MVEKLWDKVSLDAMQNTVSGMGVEGRDQLYNADYIDPEAITQVDEERAFRGDSLARKLIEKPARDMTREWVEFKSAELSKKKLHDLEKKISDLGIQAAFKSAITWARKSGAGVIWLGIDDGRTTAQPVKENAIKDIKWIKVLEKHDLMIEKKYDSPKEPLKHDEPEIYRVLNTDVLIHETRMLKFDGVLTTESQKRQNGGWSDSVLTANIQPTKHVVSAFKGILAICAEGPQTVMKIQGLATLLASDNGDLVKQRLSINDLYKSFYRSVLMDAEGEDFERYSVSAEGLPEAIDRIMVFLSACVGIPVTVFWGRSPAGMNATGESDLEIYYNWVKEEQTEKMTPMLNRLYRYLFLAKKGPTNGKMPKQWSFKYNPLWSPSDKDQAQTRQIQAYTDQVYMQNTVLLPEEVRASRFAGGEHTLDNTILDEAHYQERKKELEEQGGGGIFGTQQTMVGAQEEEEEKKNPSDLDEDESEDEGQEDDRKTVEENNVSK